jgi:hypothetical protein
MRMPFTEFIASGDLKFMLAILAVFIISLIDFFKKIKDREHQLKYNQKLEKLSKWALILGVFALLLGLMHSLYFISMAGGINPKLLYRGLANTLIAPVFGFAVCVVIKLLSTPFKNE